jgi:hypothetical protein
MVNKGPEEEPQSLPDDLGSVDTYVPDEPEGTLTRDVAGGDARPGASGVGDGTAAAATDANDDGTPKGVPDQRLYETPGFKEFQAKTDQRIAQLTSQVDQGNKARQEQQSQAEGETLERTVQGWKQQQYDALVGRGVEESIAGEMAHAYGDLAKQGYLASRGVQSAETATSAAQGQVVEQVRNARAYELAAQHQVPFQELVAINDPSYMEVHAKSLARTAKLEAQISRNNPGQVFDTSNPEASVAPSDDERILDAYAAGDTRVNKDMAEAASKRLGMSIF